MVFSDVSYSRKISWGMKKKETKLEKIQFTIQEIWQAMRGNIQKSKKQYTRKDKHKNKL
tara:strand:+ start:143 stop:319 length:177 start_codon:yes stop_codon:yes gene_type:complete